MTRYVARRPRSLIRLAVSLAALLSLGPACGQSGHAPEKEPDVKRHHFLRAAKSLLRIDTREGRVWIVENTGDGGWTALGGRPDGSGSPSENGRYGLYNLKSDLMGGPPRLLRVDRATGQSWLSRAQLGNEWTLIEEPLETSDSPEGESEEAVQESTPGVGSESTSPQANGPPEGGAPVALPVIPRETIESSPGEESEKIAVVIQALEKEGLAVEIKVWAARQLAVFPAEDALPPLLDALRNQPPEVVVAAIDSLRKLGRPSTIPKILALANHQDARVRAAVKAVVVAVP